MLIWPDVLIWIEKHPGLASWLQAIGALVGIGIAIWVPYWQRRRAMEQANEAQAQQVRHLLRNLLDEMTVVSVNFERRNGKLLMDTPIGEPFLYTIPVMTSPFPIFDASTARLGEIPDDNLRRLIITGYGIANGFVASIRFNNQMLERLEEAEYLAATHNDEIHRNIKDSHRKIMSDYSSTLQELYAESIATMRATQGALQVALNSVR